MSARATSVPRLHAAPLPDPAAQPQPRDLAAEETKRAFLRMVSHELRTPLNAIIGFSEILSCELYGPLGAPQYREYADIIHQGGMRLLRLLNQVIEIAKLQGGGADMDLRVEPVDTVFGDALKQVAEELTARGLKITVDLPSPAPAALADPRAVRTAVVNLLQNAAAYARQGGEVRLSARAQGPLVHLEIADDGDGVDPEELPRLMRPFEQGQNALTRHAEGAGLGWPIVSLLAEAMGGSFDVRSAQGQGLTATVTLRRAA